MDMSQNAEHVSENSLVDTKVDSHRSATDSHTQLRTSFNHGDENVEMQTYILSVGTVKRDVLDVSKFIESQALHKRLLDRIIKVIDGIVCLSALVDYHIKHEVILQDGISHTQQWGPIHHFYVKVIGSETLANGTAALLGQILKQDAIGIYHPLTKDDHLLLSSKQGQPLPDNCHPYFTVDSSSPISPRTTLKIIEKVCERFQELSGQLDTSGQSIEFHDFDLSFKGTSAQIEAVLNQNCQQRFQVKTHFAKSTLLTRNDYRPALDASCLVINR